MKRFFDLTLAAAGLAFLWPVLLAIAAAVKLDSAGPVIYRSRRAGLRGQPFCLLKFRTMVIDAEKLGGPSTPSDDQRVTHLGKHLRKYKLDELPQLINVLKGQMSLVGPRPEVLSEVGTYSSEELELLSVRPGITDWASIHFRNESEILQGSPDPHRTYRERIRPEKVRMGLLYVRQRSFRTDLRILAETVKVVIGFGEERH